MLSQVSVLPDQITTDKAHCSWWMVYFKQCILDQTGCAFSDRSIEGKPKRTFLLNNVDNIILQASYILVSVILYGQQK